MKETLRQNDNQTCLPNCLLIGFSYLFPEDRLDYAVLERELFIASYGVCRESYVLTHCITFSRRFPSVIVQVLVDSPEYVEALSKLNTEENVNIQQQEITLDWIKMKAREAPVIVSVDKYPFNHEVHTPHFLNIHRDESGQFMIADPFSEEPQSLSAQMEKKLEWGINQFKYHMLWSPVAISLKKASGQFN